MSTTSPRGRPAACPSTRCLCTPARSTRTSRRLACRSWSTAPCTSRRPTSRSPTKASTRRPWSSITPRRTSPSRASSSTCTCEVKGLLIAKETRQELYERYRILAEKESEVCFVGRLASYKYFNMDQDILNALEIYDSLKETGKLQPKRRPEDFGPGDGPK
mmetsp:Transcript_48369/g.155936  ORF Transcript_48369/g.155936 Transcript_48369/m.155936 type:complete len:161 (-) Transcript_48369:205-687(-)